MKTIVRSLLLTICLLYCHTSKAQIAGGIEGAITTSSVKISEIKNQFTEVIKGDGIMGFEAGIFLRGSLGPLYIKPKLLLDYQKGTVTYVVNEAKENITFYAGKVLVPVLVGYKIFPVLGVEAGPVFNYLLFSKKDFNGNHVDLKKSGMGYRIGLNAELSIFNLTLSYQGIKNNGSYVSEASYETPDQIVIGLGIQF